MHFLDRKCLFWWKFHWDIFPRVQLRSAVPETGIQGRNKQLRPTDTMEYNYLSLPLTPASGTTLPNQQWARTSSDNGLATVQEQAIIWKSDGLFYWHTYASLPLTQINTLFISHHYSWVLYLVYILGENSGENQPLYQNHTASMYLILLKPHSNWTKLEQLERLRSEDTLRHTIGSYWIPSQSYKFKEFAKISNFLIFKQTLHWTHLLKLLDKMCKYKMDPANLVEDTERTPFCPLTDRRTRWNQYTPFQLHWSGGYNYTPALFSYIFSMIWTSCRDHSVDRFMDKLLTIFGICSPLRGKVWFVLYSFMFEFWMKISTFSKVDLIICLL